MFIIWVEVGLLLNVVIKMGLIQIHLKARFYVLRFQVDLNVNCIHH